MTKKPLSESDLKRRYDDHVTRLGGWDVMPRYDQLSENMIALWRAIEELDEDDIATAVADLIKRC